MAIANDTIKRKVSGDGTTREFSFPFKIYGTDDLSVWLIDKTTDEVTQRTITTHYLVDIDLVDEGGTIIFDEDHIPTANDWVFMFSNLAFVQSVVIPTNGRLLEKSVTNGMDRIVRLVQQLRDKVNRAPVLPIQSQISGLELPDPESLRLLRWNEDADGLENRDAIPEVELRKEGDWLQWKLTQDDTWENLVELTDITGPKGDTGEVEEAPIDGTIYGRQDAGWAEVTADVEEAPIDGDQYARKDAGWVQVEGGDKIHLEQTPQELTDAANISWDMDSGGYGYVTLGGNRTLDNPTNVVAGGTYKLRITQDATGSREITWGTNFDFPGAVEPVLTSTANGVDEFTFYAHSTTKLVCQNAVFDV